MRAVERRGGGDLDRGEGAVVEVGLDPGQRVDEAGVADGEAHAPAGHRVGLGERGELDRDVAGAVDLQDRGRRIAVEIDLGIGEIGQHPEVMFLREGYEIAVEVEIADLGRRVGRKGDHHRHRPRHRVGHRAVERPQVLLRIEAAVVERRDVAERAAGDHEAVGVDRIARVRDEHDVAGGGDRHGEVGEAFLGAEGGDHLGLGVELHPEAAGVVAGLGAAEAGDALGGGIAVGAGARDGLDKLFDDMGGRVHVGIAHAEVDDVHALGAVAGLEPVDLGEDVGRQALDAVEFFGHGGRGDRVAVAPYSAAEIRATGDMEGVWKAYGTHLESVLRLILSGITRIPLSTEHAERRQSRRREPMPRLAFAAFPK